MLPVHAGRRKNEESMSTGVSHGHWNVDKIQKEIHAFEAPIWQSLWIFKNLSFIGELLRIPQFVALKNWSLFSGVHIVFLLRLQWASRHHCCTSCPCCCGYHFSVGLTNIGGFPGQLGCGAAGWKGWKGSRWGAAARDILFAASNWIHLEEKYPRCQCLSWLVYYVIAKLNNLVGFFLCLHFSAPYPCAYGRETARILFGKMTTSTTASRCWISRKVN